ncbi:hypothetical protein NKG05_16245 [Oerskovia sp. M15]
MVGWHGGIADSFRASSDYLQLIGGQFACHPGREPDERRGDQADNYVPHTIDIVPEAADHPIVAASPASTWSPSSTGCSATTSATSSRRRPCPPRVGAVAPAAHTAGRLDTVVGRRPHLRGHPGHDVETLGHPSVRTMIERSMSWAMR